MAKTEQDKFDPVKEFINLRDSITRSVEGTIRNVAGLPEANRAFPPLDVYETDSSVLIRTAFMVGIKPESLEISMEKNVLTLSGVTADPLEIDESSYIHRELTFGPFARSVPIPRPVDASEATAKFKKGVLTITLPKIDRDSPDIVDVTPAE